MVRFLIMVVLLITLFTAPAIAEVSWADIPLVTATPYEQEETLSSIISVVSLNAQEDIKIGDIVFVDIIDTTLLVAVEYYENITQLWVWDIFEGFKHGYEIALTYPPSRGIYRSFCLSPDGTVLYYVGKGGAILGLYGSNKSVKTEVYSKPLYLEDYDRPNRSAYKCVDHKNGRIIVSSSTGEHLTVFDFTEAYNKYRADYNSKLLPSTILYIIWITIFLISIAWLIHNNRSHLPHLKRSSQNEHKGGKDLD